MIRYTIEDLKNKSINTLIDENDRFVIITDDTVIKEEEDKIEYVSNAIEVLRRKADKDK